MFRSPRLALIRLIGLVWFTTVVTMFGPSVVDSSSGQGVSRPTLSPTLTPGTCTDGPSGISAGSGSVRSIRLGHPLSALAVSQATGHVFAFSQATYQDRVDHCPNRIYMFDAQAATLLQTVAVPGEFSSPVVDDRRNRVLVATWVSGNGDGKVVMLDARSDRVLATVMVGGFPGPIIIDEKDGRAFVYTYGPNCCNPQVKTIDIRTARVIPTPPIPIGQSFALDTNRQRVYTMDGQHLQAFDGQTGRRLWTRGVRPCGTSYRLTFVPQDDRLFISKLGYVDARSGQKQNGYLCVLDAAAHRIVHLRNEGPGGRILVLAIDEPAQAVLGIVPTTAYVGGAAAPSTTGQVVVLDPGDAHVVRRLGVEASDAVVDSQTGRVYLLQLGFHTATILMLNPHGWRSTVLAQDVQATTMALSSRMHRLFLASPFSDTVTILCTAKNC